MWYYYLKQSVFKFILIDMWLTQHSNFYFLVLSITFKLLIQGMDLPEDMRRLRIIHENIKLRMLSINKT